ncbi:MAG: GDP-mannose 4,6-dehydratase [Nitrospinaceae bacterium]|nr:MAG: GDP-mannose 4,6-dehydratase [Nitrospinaceae bacterium]
MNILITGGAGFIGSHLAHLHLQKGDRVHVVDDLSTGRRTNIALLLGHARFTFSEADIVTWDGLDAAIHGIDRVYHLAAVVGVRRTLEDPVRVVKTNIAGTERVMRAIEKSSCLPEVLIASSSEAYGFNPRPTFRETDDLLLHSRDRLRWCYAVSKLTDEFIAFSYADKFGFKLTVVRLFNTIGPRQVEHYGMVVPNFVQQAVTGRPITVYGDGSQTRSFADVRDTVRALDLLAGNPLAAGETVNVGADQEISILALAELVRERAESDSEIIFIPYHEAYGEDFEDITHRRPCLDKLFQLTGFQHQWSLTATIDDLILRARAERGLLEAKELGLS